MFIDMLNHPQYPNLDYSSVRSGLVAGAPCPVVLCSRLVNELGMKDLQVPLSVPRSKSSYSPLLNIPPSHPQVCYGTTETSPVSFMSIREDPPEERIRNVGHIMDHLEAIVVDHEGRVVPRGERGDCELDLLDCHLY
jgi:fatty-acyl-CoA synthase